jgi:hypothetical protein
MSPEITKAVAAGVLLLHGLGHGGALGALIWIAFRPGDESGGWRAARSWIVPTLPPEIATGVASAFWILSLVGFVSAALAFLGILLPVETWRAVAVGSAIVSLAGILFFLGTWPPFNTIAALLVNLAVLVTQLVLRWPQVGIPRAT